MSRAFFQLLQLEALVTIIAHFLVVIAYNVRKIFGALWYLLVSRARRGGVRTANRCSPTLGIKRLPAVLHRVILLDFFNPMVVSLFPNFILVKWDVINPAAPYAFCFFGFEGF